MFVCLDEVRDSQLDAQGIVNNSVYFNYMEHTRHKHLSSLGVDFIKLHEQGYDLVISEVNMKFKQPLSSTDKFLVTSEFNLKTPVRVIAKQKIFKLSHQAYADLLVNRSGDLGIKLFGLSGNCFNILLEQAHKLISNNSENNKLVADNLAQDLNQTMQLLQQHSPGDFTLVNEASYSITCVKQGDQGGKSQLGYPDFLKRLFL